MKILLTGATGYIGKRLLPLLVNLEHEVICCVQTLLDGLSAIVNAALTAPSRMEACANAPGAAIGMR